MDIRVVDASAVAAVLFSEPEAGIVAPRMSGVKLVAPTLLEFELAHVCLKKLRRYPPFREKWRTAHRLRTELHIQHMDIDCDAVLELAETSGLTAYDACYLLLARELGTELITLDRQLAAAAAT